MNSIHPAACVSNPPHSSRHIQTPGVSPPVNLTPERRNEGTDGVPGDGYHPILSQHWPNVPASVIEAERMAG